jgi:anti-sigma regulatory factor (Ser/Thr protein kinase)
MVPPTAYRIRFSADPVQLILFRGGLDRWLVQLDWPEAERVDVLLAVSEACCNAVRHAYAGAEPGDVEVIGRLVLGPADRRLRWTVRDHGRWRADPDGTGFGLPTVRACMERVAVRPDERGTVVTMTSRPVALIDPPPTARTVSVPRAVGGADEPVAAGVRPVLRAVPGPG